jgi:NAD(P)-dependent dehydrogenase (short-subunit alcohol dehydrogenase family)
MPNADFSKWVRPEDVAAEVALLADELADHVTGTCVPIDGSRG